MDETGLLGLIQTSAQGSEAVELGIGDDAAVLRATAERRVVSVDTHVEEVHFRRRWLSPFELGYRATMAALSDLAAMGAFAEAVFANLQSPKETENSWLAELVRGQQIACEQCGCSLAGGNISAAGELSIATTVVGRVAHKGFLRSDGKPGDRLWISGPVGGARAGLALLLEEVFSNSPDGQWAKEVWKKPQAALGAWLSMPPTRRAAIDISDGLVKDLGHLAHASGVDIQLDKAQLQALAPEPLTRLARELNQDVLAWQLWGGEDYQVAITGGEELAAHGFMPIGKLAAGDGQVWLMDEGSEPAALAGGFSH